MISVLVAHLNVDHNLPAQSDIAISFFSLEKNKIKLQQFSDPWDCFQNK